MDNLGLSGVPATILRILLLILRLLCSFVSFMSAYLEDVLPAFLLTCSPTKRIPFPLYGSGFLKLLSFAAA